MSNSIILVCLFSALTGVGCGSDASKLKKAEGVAKARQEHIQVLQTNLGYCSEKVDALEQELSACQEISKQSGRE